ncbi:hypothetical protein EVG20_g1413 [Dentipellis fragilis]|uniref:F-box domain-containing protein n=1 Tax=Dentipellis fragilis TaxID=205917 RepID=A0A4Y9ZCM0_9AGAM|nr:hypothetical protein EVG20_g1413 [Dentipellis fragilis]
MSTSRSQRPPGYTVLRSHAPTRRAQDHTAKMPPELLGKIFDELDPVFVATLQRVCKRWLYTIKTNVILQHDAAILRGGLRRGAPEHLPAIKKLEIVAHHQKAWATFPACSLNKPFYHAKDSPREVTVKASENVMVEMTESGFQFTSFISGRLRDPARNTPSRIELKDEYGSMDIDASQDLFAWVEYVHRTVHNRACHVMEVHMKDFRRGAHHNLAFTRGTFNYIMPLNSSVISSKLVIAGDFIAVGSAFIEDRRSSRSLCPLTVFNWKTGHIALDLCDAWLFDFCFLDERHLLFYSRGFHNDNKARNQDVLLVYDLKTHGSQRTSVSESSTYVCGFSMPDTAMRGTNYPSLRTSLPLPSSLANSLINIHISNGHYGPQGMKVFGYVDILFRASSMRRRIAACVEGQPRIFRWEEWGPSDTQTTRIVSRERHVNSNFLTGMRAVDLMKDKNGKLCLYIRDFDRSRIALAKAQGDRNVMESTTVEARTWGHERITTHLPYLLRGVSLPRVPGLQDMDARYTQCTVTEDGVIIYDPYGRCPIRVLYL